MVPYDVCSDVEEAHGEMCVEAEVRELRLWMCAARLEAHEPEDRLGRRTIYARQAERYINKSKADVRESSERSPEYGNDEVILLYGKCLRNRNRSRWIVDLLPAVLLLSSCAQCVAQINVEQCGLSARWVALPVDGEEIVVAEKERPEELSLGGNHEPWNREVLSYVVPRRFPPLERLQSVDYGTTRQVPHRIVHTRLLDTIEVLQEKGTLDYVVYSSAAETETCDISRSQARNDLLNELSRERE